MTIERTLADGHIHCGHWRTVVHLPLQILVCCRCGAEVEYPPPTGWMGAVEQEKHDA